MVAGLEYPEEAQISWETCTVSMRQNRNFELDPQSWNSLLLVNWKTSLVCLGSSTKPAWQAVVLTLSSAGSQHLWPKDCSRTGWVALDKPSPDSTETSSTRGPCFYYFFYTLDIRFHWRTQFLFKIKWWGKSLDSSRPHTSELFDLGQVNYSEPQFHPL